MCLLADGGGTVLSESQGGGANLQSSGELEVEKVLHTVMDEAIGDRGLPAAICLGMAGVDREEDASVIQGIMRRIGYKARVIVVNDALIALVAAIGTAPGIVIVSGTGSIAYGRNAAGRAARAGGWGYILGDEGSGYWMGRHALRAVVREADGRGSRTALTGLVLRHFGVERAADLVREVYRRGLRPHAIAALAVHVQTAVDAGDEVGQDILSRGAAELVASARSVTQRLELVDQAFPFVLAGGVLRSLPALAREVTTRLPGIARKSSSQMLQGEPAKGAVLLALAEAEGKSSIPVYA